MSLQTQLKEEFRHPSDPNQVLRFTLGERISHWAHGISFLILLLTGVGILSPTFRPILAVFGGVQSARNIHRIVSVIFFVMTVGMFFVGNSKFHWYWLKSMFSFSSADRQHIMAFPKEFFGGHGQYPPQGKYNGGEKINSLITLLGSVFITLSGVVMWFAPSFPPELVRWAYPLHDLTFFIMTAAFLGHLYLSLLHPGSRAALSGMLSGYVSTKFAKAHHGAWFEELKNPDAKKKERK